MERGRWHVVVDETPIGNFAEIEGPPRWIDATAKKLGVGRRDYITQNYAALFFAWKETARSAAAEMTFAAVRGRGRPRQTTALPPPPCSFGIFDLQGQQYTCRINSERVSCAPRTSRVRRLLDTLRDYVA